MATQNLKKILIIDDDPEIHKILGVFLKGRYALSGAMNGKLALDELEKQSDLPDLIILDMEMPVMDGPTFRKTIKSHSKFKDIPIIYFTANDQFNDKLDHEFEFDFLNKPIEKEDLIAVLESFFRS